MQLTLNYHPENTCCILPGPGKVKPISLILCGRNLKLPQMPVVDGTLAVTGVSETVVPGAEQPYRWVG